MTLISEITTLQTLLLLFFAKYQHSNDFTFFAQENNIKTQCLLIILKYMAVRNIMFLITVPCFLSFCDCSQKSSQNQCRVNISKTKAAKTLGLLHILEWHVSFSLFFHA